MTERAQTLFVGIGGTSLAVITEKQTAIFAGIATGCWMLWQLVCSIHDRLKK